MRTLFISYDGMTDPLGRSQVLPYLSGLAARGMEVCLLSCEKPEKWKVYGHQLELELRRTGIEWRHISYQAKPKFLGPMWNKARMKRAAFQWYQEKKFDLVHCRSHLPTLIGSELKRRYGVPYIFDMRGFWADERVDGGIWNLDKLSYRTVYRYFKKKERELLIECDGAVTLTQAAKTIIENWNLPRHSKQAIEVIPCCADLKHFDRQQVNVSKTSLLREKLKLDGKTPVIGYLGSVGTWYLLDEMMHFFKEAQAQFSQAIFLFVTQDNENEIFLAAERAGVNKDALRVISAQRDEVPALVSLFDVGLFFIQPVYSKQASSATKFAELLAMGVPVITNLGVGDNDYFLARYNAGIAVKNFEAQDFQGAAEKIPALLKISKEELREIAKKEFSLELGVDRYEKLYRSLSLENKNT